MDTNVFCVICGAPFFLEENVFKVDHDKEAYKWIFDVQLLGTISSFRNMEVVTSSDRQPTNESRIAKVLLSEPTSWAFSDDDFFQVDGTYYKVLQGDEDGDVVIPLHSMCIEIACKAIEAHITYESANSSGLLPIVCLYHGLRDQFHYTITFGRSKRCDVLSLDSECEKYGERSLLGVDMLGWWGDEYEKFLWDPMHIPELAPWLENNLLSSRSRGPESTMTISASNRQLTRLESLPPELINRIIDFLHSESILALRSTSKSMALKIPLDDRFWRDHILNGKLLPHAWEVTSTAFQSKLREAQHDGRCNSQWTDFRKLVQLAGKSNVVASFRDLREPEIPLGYWNRCRIWKIIEDSIIRPHSRRKAYGTILRNNIDTTFQEGE
ncbi:hypothetical protein BCR34DRAFT_75650 [Clohesyomyces aquaticus]|uniref:F-box domain-containing protein n=1 Tax=Clohesyomyces aquaticus TaxID=1231657 RepID=A0A1Y2A3A1_9PLEO|nr:hypothetical protein BCR34DRAFT_75650 [Clohesyomyces aquaticus]